MASLTRRQAVKGMVVGSAGVVLAGTLRRPTEVEHECRLLVLDLYEHAYHGLWCGGRQLR